MKELDNPLRRSQVLVPAHRTDLLDKANRFEADVLIIDLQDSVPMESAVKALARTQAAQFLVKRRWQARATSLRVNGPASPWIIEDIRLAVAHGVDSITLPEVINLRDLLFVEGLLVHFSREGGVAGPSVQLEVETPALLCQLDSISAQSERVDGLCVAPFDYALNTRAKVALIGQAGAASDLHLSWLRPQLIAVARAHGWSATDAVMVADPRDMSQLAAALERSRQLGFDGSAVLHPSHLQSVNQAFSPTAQEIEWATTALANDNTLRQHQVLARQILTLNEKIVSPRSL